MFVWVFHRISGLVMILLFGYKIIQRVRHRRGTG